MPLRFPRLGALVVLATLALLAFSARLAAQRPTGVVGAYVPPRAWPQEPRRFDLLHQRIRLRFDVPRRELFGEVTTRLVITQVRQAALAIIAGARQDHALALLVAASGSDQVAAIRATAITLLGGLRDPGAAEAFERATAPAEDRRIRTSALSALAQTGDSARVTALALRLVQDPDATFAASAVRIVGRFGGTDGRARLALLLPAEKRNVVRAALAEALH